MSNICDVMIEDSRWETAGLEALAERAARAVFDHFGYGEAGFEISVLGCDDARISALNADYRGKPQATNVLSWPSAERGAQVVGGVPSRPDGDPELGDIAIAYDTCLAEAESAGKPLSDHVTHLMCHGILHLLGYDHVHDADASLMEGLETDILSGLGLPDPYL